MKIVYIFFMLILLAWKPLYSQIKDEKDLKLLLFYNFLLKNEKLEGLPNRYDIFKGAMLNPVKSQLFYNSLWANPSLKDYVPATYIEFLDLYGLINKPQKQYYYYPEPAEQRQERSQSLLSASRLIIDAIGGSQGAAIIDYSSAYGQPSGNNTSSYYIYPKLSGTTFRDYTKSGVRVEGNTVYRTIPGTDFRDYSSPGYMLQGNSINKTLPGTTFLDYSSPGYIVIPSK